MFEFFYYLLLIPSPVTYHTLLKVYEKLLGEGKRQGAEILRRAVVRVTIDKAVVPVDEFKPYFWLEPERSIEVLQNLIEVLIIVLDEIHKLKEVASDWEEISAYPEELASVYDVA